MNINSALAQPRHRMAWVVAGFRAWTIPPKKPPKADTYIGVADRRLKGKASGYRAKKRKTRWVYACILCGPNAAPSIGKPADSALRQRRVHAFNRLIHLASVFETDHHRVQFRQGHGETNGLLAVLGVDEFAVADNFHADDAAPLRPHRLKLGHHGRNIMHGVVPDRFLRSVNAAALRIGGTQVD